jgi:hypothetical protein
MGRVTRGREVLGVSNRNLCWLTFMRQHSQVFMVLAASFCCAVVILYRTVCSKLIIVVMLLFCAVSDFIVDAEYDTRVK